MKASCGLYPALGRFFKTKKHLADVGGMSRSRLDDCLNGRKEFTRQEKRAITTDIMVRLFFSEIQDKQISLLDMYFAYNGKFDELFRITESEKKA